LSHIYRGTIQFIYKKVNTFKKSYYLNWANEHKQNSAN